MIVTGAFLAEFARVSDGKLDVLGGVVTSWNIPPGQPAMPMLIVLTQAEGADSTESIPINVYDSGNPVVTDSIAVPAITRRGEDAGFFFHQLGILPPRSTRCVIVVGSDDIGTVSIPMSITIVDPEA